MAADRVAEAAEAWVALAHDAPDHALAPEALFSAAEAYEDKLADPAHALALYAEIEKRYPDSRRALASSRRAGALRLQIGPDAVGLEAQRRFLIIRQGFAGRPEAESIAMAEALLRDQPEWPGAPGVALWLAALDQRRGRMESALARYVAAAGRYALPEARFDAWISAAEVAVELGRYGDAASYLARLDAGGDPGRQVAIDEGWAQLARARQSSRWRLVAWILAVAGFLALAGSLAAAARSPARAARALWPPPGEVLYLGPVGALLVAVAYTDYQGLGPAVVVVSAAGLVVTWLSGAALDEWRRRGDALSRRRWLALRVAHALAAAAAVAAMAYLALLIYELLDPVLETLRYGPDR